MTSFRVLTLSLLLLCLAPLSRAESTNDAIARATAAMQAAVPRAQADPARPVFHVISPAQWMNDPNGPIFYKGWYHLFYQLNPFSDGDGPKHWGHVRSRDLVKWEPLPIALWPSSEQDESGVWSGCCTINGDGKPMIFYTSIARGRPALTHSEQWAATSDDDLITWHKSPANPVLSDALHGETKIYDWRDPFIFKDHDRTFMVVGGNLNRAKGGEAVVNIYEAENPALTQWKYRGVLYKLPDAGARTVECPNFFKLDGRWVLFVSPYGKVQYFTGDFDASTCRFTPHMRGTLDYGPNFYAPNTLQAPDGRRIVWGWVNGFPGGRGWNGCLTLPRLLSLERDGRLKQSPAPQLTKLRGKQTAWRNVPLEGDDNLFELPTNTLEIELDLELYKAKNVTLEFKSGTDGAQPVLMNINDSGFKLVDTEVPLPPSGLARKVSMRIFMDRSVLEVFANDVRCATKVITPFDAQPTMTIHVQGGRAKGSVHAWPLKTIW